MSTKYWEGTDRNKQTLLQEVKFHQARIDWLNKKIMALSQVVGIVGDDQSDDAITTIRYLQDAIAEIQFIIMKHNDFLNS